MSSAAFAALLFPARSRNLPVRLRERAGKRILLQRVLLEEDEGCPSLFPQALESSAGFAHQPPGPGMLRSRNFGSRKQFLAGKPVHMHGIFSSKICDVFEDIK